MFRNERYPYGVQFSHNIKDPGDWRAPLVDIDIDRGNVRRIWLNVTDYLNCYQILIPNRGSVTLFCPDGSESKLTDDRIRGLVRAILDDGAPVEPLLDYVTELWPELEPVVQAIVRPPSSA